MPSPDALDAAHRLLWRQNSNGTCACRKPVHLGICTTARRRLSPPVGRQAGRCRPGRGAKKGQGDSWLRGALGQAALGAARTPTFLGERYHRIARRRGKAKAQVAVARSILVIIWHLLKNPETRFADLGPGHYQGRLDTSRKLRNHIQQIQALGFDVTLTKTA